MECNGNLKYNFTPELIMKKPWENEIISTINNNFKLTTFASTKLMKSTTYIKK